MPKAKNKDYCEKLCVCSRNLHLGTIHKMV